MGGYCSRKVLFVQPKYHQSFPGLGMSTTQFKLKGRAYHLTELAREANAEMKHISSNKLRELLSQ